jgi:hypothetical protein
MNHTSTAFEDAGCDAPHEHGAAAGGQPEAESPGRGPTQRVTTQAERAVMHPERHDTEWRYYHGAWCSEVSGPKGPA